MLFEVFLNKGPLIFGEILIIDYKYVILSQFLNYIIVNPGKFLLLILSYAVNLSLKAFFSIPIIRLTVATLTRKNSSRLLE